MLDAARAGLSTTQEERVDAVAIGSPHCSIDELLELNSGKFAHYAPGNTGYAVQYGALSECVESAVSGKLIRDERLWA